MGIRPVANLFGKKFGRLTVLFQDSSNTVGRTKWVCLCSCGTIKVISAGDLMSGDITSCRCAHRDMLRERNIKHGLSGTPTHATWCRMINRCTNKNGEDYHNYGGRGITVCDRWMNSFENFLADMGEKPSKKMSIDRINNDGPYSPDNCRWATNKEQSLNKRTNALLTIKGVTKTQTEWAYYTGINQSKISRRTRSGMSDAQALEFE